MKKVAVLYSEYTPIIDAIKYQLSDCVVDCLQSTEKLEGYDFIVLSNYKGDCEYRAIACHHSILPAFDSENPVSDAVMAGVKLTGITIYYTDTKQILAQYPVFINNKHYDELEQEIIYTEQIVFPLVIEKVIKNETFEIQNLIKKKGCSTGCGGCLSCSH